MDKTVTQQHECFSAEDMSQGFDLWVKLMTKSVTKSAIEDERQNLSFNIWFKQVNPVYENRLNFYWQNLEFKCNENLKHTENIGNIQSI